MATTQQSATQIIRDDHKRMRGLFRQAEAEEARAPAMRPGILRQIAMEVEIHDQIERELLYPAASEGGGISGGAFAADYEKAHDEIGHTLGVLRQLMEREPSGISTDLDRVLQALTLQTDTHMINEERDLLGIMDRTMDPESLARLGEKIELRKIELRADPRFRDALPDQVQDPNGGEQMRKGHPKVA